MLLGSIAGAQSSNKEFRKASLYQVFIEFEEHSEYVLNFDPSVAKKIEYTGVVDLSKPNSEIAKVLSSTNLDFTIDGNSLIIFPLAPKEYYLCGYIKEANSKESLIGANITVEDHSGTQSNEDGYFELSITAQKNDRITISYIGYADQIFRVKDLAADHCIDINMTIDMDLWQEEIVIKGYILDGIKESTNYYGQELNFQRLSKNHATVEHDILKTIQLLPGINSIDESASNLQIRGAAGDQNLILWEGITIYQPSHIFGMITAINPFSISQIEVHKGIWSPEYDNRVGGIVDISLNNKLKDKTSGSIGFSLTEAHFNIEAPVVTDKLQLAISARSSMSALYNSPPLNNYSARVFQFSKIDDNSVAVRDGEINSNQDLDFSDVSSKLIYRPIDAVTLDFNYYRNNQDFTYQYSFPNDPLNYESTDNIKSKSEAFKAHLSWDINYHFSSSFSFINSTYQNDYDILKEEEGLIISNSKQNNEILDQNLSYSMDYEYENIDLNWGYEHNSKDVKYSTFREHIDDPTFEDRSTEEGTFHNLFLSANWSIKDFSLSSGLRSTYYSDRSKWYHSPRMSLQYRLNDLLKIKAEAGILYQFISQIQQFNPESLTNEYPIWTLHSNEPNLTQKSFKLSTGINYSNDGWLIDATLYKNETQGLNTYSPLFNQAPIDFFSIGNAEAIGIELLLKKSFNKNYNAWINYSMANNQLTFPDISNSSFNAPNDIRHQLSLINTYQYKNLRIALNTNYHSGLAYSSPFGIISEYDAVDDETNYFLDYRILNQNRLKDYLRLDLNINYKVDLNRFKDSKLELSLSLINLLNQQNIFAQEHFLLFEENVMTPQIAFIQKSLLPRTPLLICRFYW